MTMPHLMNCDHMADGWCLECVGQLHAYAEALNARCIADTPDAERWRQIGAPITDEHRAELEALSHAAEQAHLQMTKDAERYRKLRNGQNWPAVFARHDAPEPLSGVDLDAALDGAA